METTFGASKPTRSPHRSRQPEEQASPSSLYFPASCSLCLTPKRCYLRHPGRSLVFSTSAAYYVSFLHTTSRFSSPSCSFIQSTCTVTTCKTSYCSSPSLWTPPVQHFVN